jgi:hypothetical protein
MSDLSIEKLWFGSDDAELEEKRGFLNKVFLKTSIYNRVKNAQREIVIGRKGTGKSAICLMLKNTLESDGEKVLLITPKSLSQTKIEKLRLNSINDDDAYIMGWKYALLTTIGLELIKLAKRTKIIKTTKQIKPDLLYIQKFLESNNEIEKSALKKFFSKASIFSKVSLKIFNIEGSAETRQVDVTKDTATELENFQSSIEIVLRELHIKRYVILIDKVDDIWNQTNKSELMIKGLLKAVHELNTALLHTLFILFLRSDIYDEMFKIHDGDKFHSGEERIVWNKRDLKHLITMRARVSANMVVNDVDEIWNTVFERKVNGNTSFDYIIDRTLHKPREIIQFCNSALAQAQDKKHQFIQAQDILGAEKQYSVWKLKDIVSEYAVQYPFLEEALFMFQGFKPQLTYGEFENRLKETKDKLHDNLELQKATTEKVLQILFIVGFLGANINGEKVFSHINPYVVLSQHNIFIVHPAFYSALGFYDIGNIGMLNQSPTDPDGSDDSSTKINIRNISGSQVNVGGTIVQGNYSTRLQISRQIEQLGDEISTLESEKQRIWELLKTNPDKPAQLQYQLQDIKYHLGRLYEGLNETKEKIDYNYPNRYNTLATSQTPALVIYVLDISGSMSNPLFGRTRIEIITDALYQALQEMAFRSTKGGRISPRYRIAMYAYSDDVYDILGGIKPIDKVAQMGVPKLIAQRATDTARAFRQVEILLKSELPNLGNCPAPLVCHITDGEYTGDDPTPIMQRIMGMSNSDGDVLLTNTFIADEILKTPIKSASKWKGILDEAEIISDYARVLFQNSSIMPLSYRSVFLERGYSLIPGARLFFPGLFPEFLEMSFTMSMSTPTSSAH